MRILQDRRIVTGFVLAMVWLTAGPRSGAPGRGLLLAVGAHSRSQDAGAQASELLPKYTGERISVNLKDVDLKDFFRLIHEVSGLNIIVDPNVSGTLTLVLNNVPWDQALAIVLKNNGLDKSLDGNVLRIAKIQTLTAEADERAKLIEAQGQAEPLVTVFRRLHYAQAKMGATSTGTGGVGTGAASQNIPGVVDIIQGLKGGGVLSPRGSVEADSRNNTVIITDIESQIPIVESFIDKLDQKSPQVSIEARVVLANSNFVRTLGVQLAGLVLNKAGSVMSGGVVGPGGTVGISPPTGTATSNSTGTNVQTTTQTGSGNTTTSTANGNNNSTLSVQKSGTAPPGPAINIGPVSAAGSGIFAISNASARYLINAAISAAETSDQAKTISSPNIVTQNNMVGEVVQGVQIPIQTTVNNTVTTVYVNAALQLDVVPQVTDDGHVFLSIKVTNSSPGAVLPNSSNPEINTQSATTQVLVPDGGTVVFGGVKINNRDRVVDKVPGLGNLPIVGNLFKTTNTLNQSQELIFIVTPKILPG